MVFLPLLLEGGFWVCLAEPVSWDLPSLACPEAFMMSSDFWETQQYGSNVTTGTGLETMPRKLTPNSSVLSLGASPERVGVVTIPRILWSLFYFISSAGSLYYA